MSDEIPGWDGYNVRTDRTQVVRQHDTKGECWVIVPHDERPAITLCPCCDRVFRTARAAKLVCNAIYPLPEAGSPAGGQA